VLLDLFFFYKYTAEQTREVEEEKIFRLMQKYQSENSTESFYYSERIRAATKLRA